MNKYIVVIIYRAFDREFRTKEFIRSSIPTKDAARRYVKNLCKCPTFYLIGIDAEEILQTRILPRVEFKNDWLNSE